MQFFTASDLESKGSARLTRNALYASRYETAGTMLANEANENFSFKSYDVFLSHSFLDAKTIYGLKGILEENQFSTYVYWIEDSRQAGSVTPETAERLRDRMKCCKSLLYATSENADNSKWMPWELGYFDGIRGKVAVCPITTNSSFQGREYLGLYPFMERDFWLWKDGRAWKTLRGWLNES